MATIPIDDLRHFHKLNFQNQNTTGYFSLKFLNIRINVYTNSTSATSTTVVLSLRSVLSTMLEIFWHWRHWFTLQLFFQSILFMNTEEFWSGKFLSIFVLFSSLEANLPAQITIIMKDDRLSNNDKITKDLQYFLNLSTSFVVQNSHPNHWIFCIEWGKTDFSKRHSNNSPE